MPHNVQSGERAGRIPDQVVVGSAKVIVGIYHVLAVKCQENQLLHHTRGSPDHIISRRLAINVEGQFDVAVARREFELHLLDPVALVEVQETFPRCAILFAYKYDDSGVPKQLFVELVALVLDLAPVGILGLPRDTSFLIGHEVMSDGDPILCPHTIVGANFVILKPEGRVGPIVDMPVFWVRGFECGIYPQASQVSPQGPGRLDQIFAVDLAFTEPD